MILVIDPTVSGSLTLMLIEGKKIVSVSKKKGTIKLTEKLVSFVDVFLRKRKKSFKNLKGVIVVTGPGSFTSVRVACIVANTLGQVLRIGLFGAPLDRLDTAEKILKSLSSLRKGKYVIPYYDKGPNITIPK